MRVLVTGALGYVGRSVACHLVAAGHPTVGLTRGRADGTPGPAGVRLVTGDLLDTAGLCELVREERIDAACHLAALPGAVDSARQPLACYTVNVQGTVSLLRALDQAGRGRKQIPVVFASTCAVYARDPSQPCTEDDRLAPSHPYGASKLAAEQVIGFQAALGRLAATSLRCVNIAGGSCDAGDGAGSRPAAGIIARAVSAAAVGEPLDIDGDGSATREFVHVDDVARAFVLALTAGRSGGHRVFNVGGGAVATVRDVLTAVERVTGRPVPVRYREGRSEPPLPPVDCDRIRRELGWHPRRSYLDQLVADTWRARCA